MKKYFLKWMKRSRISLKQNLYLLETHTPLSSEHQGEPSTTYLRWIVKCKFLHCISEQIFTTIVYPLEETCSHIRAKTIGGKIHCIRVQGCKGSEILGHLLVISTLVNYTQNCHDILRMQQKWVIMDYQGGKVKTVTGIVTCLYP